TTAAYALNLYNLQYDQKLELQHLQQQVEHLQAENANLVEQVQAAEVQNEELQLGVNQLDHQLQHILLNDGANIQIHENAEEQEKKKKKKNLPRFRESLVLFLVFPTSLSTSMEPT